MSKTSSPNIFINGKQQVIELLQQLSSDERNRILSVVRAKNPGLAKELSEKSFSIHNLEHISKEHLRIVINHVSAPIMGVALKGCRESLQRRILSSAGREYAEEAFRVLRNPIENERVMIPRAQNKILETVMTLIRREQVYFQ